jgi:hypothetical protein
MKSYRKELWFNTPERLGFINITGEVLDCLRTTKPLPPQPDRRGQRRCSFETAGDGPRGGRGSDR